MKQSVRQRVEATARAGRAAEYEERYHPVIFDSYAAAEAYIERTPSAHSIFSNTPNVGEWTVTHDDESGREEWATSYGPQWAVHTAYEFDLEADAERLVAQECADAANLSGKARGYFIAGFCGCDAKTWNPRADGMEPIFRDGRKARQASGIARRIRVAVATLRSGRSFKAWVAGYNDTLPHLRPWVV